MDLGECAACARLFSQLRLFCASSCCSARRFCDPDIDAVSQESSGSLAPNRSRIFTHSLMHVSQVKPAALSLVRNLKSSVFVFVS